ncbi:MAG: hypothetical protein M3348_13520 [Acidobacteriota bacterium]|nr:hypothetical protein [Acidobacteriota bacterium]
MSDYLWDKTGEPEEDVERLEELLGSFRHHPRALERPAESAAPARVGPRAPRLLRAPGFAVAAALILAFTAGALFLLGRGAGDARREPAQAASQKSKGDVRKDSARQNPSPPSVESGNDKATPGLNEASKRDEQTGQVEPAVKVNRALPDERTLRDERAARLTLPHNAERRQGVGEAALKQRVGAAVAGSRGNEREEVGGAGREEMGGRAARVAAESERFGEGRAEKEQPLEERRRAAKDDLMYVLRLTGLKLKEVQKKTQKVDGWKSAFDEQKPNQLRK